MKIISLETNSNLSKKIIENFDKEIFNFIQVCPKEMIDKLENPISLKPIIKKLAKVKNINIFCFGFGQVAKNFISKVKLENYNINLSSTSQNMKLQKKNLMELIIKIINLIMKNMIKIL